MKFVLAAFAAGIALGYFVRPKPRRQPAVFLALFNPKGDHVINLPGGATASYPLTPLAADGQPGYVESLETSLSSPECGEVTVSRTDTGFLIDVKATGVRGVGTLEARADTKIGDQVRYLIATVEIAFAGAEATSISFGTPTVTAAPEPEPVPT